MTLRVVQINTHVTLRDQYVTRRLQQGTNSLALLELTELRLLFGATILLQQCDSYDCEMAQNSLNSGH